MNDSDGPVVAQHFYQELFKPKNEHINPDDVAYALHNAVQELKARKLPPSRWVTYVHIGL